MTKVCMLRKFRAKTAFKRRDFTRRHNVPVFNITCKAARNWCKKSYVTCYISENYEMTLCYCITDLSCDKHKYFYIL